MYSHTSNIDTFHLSTHIAITIIGRRYPTDGLYQKQVAASIKIYLEASQFSRFQRKSTLQSR